jgi:hypothetical protein
MGRNYYWGLPQETLGLVAALGVATHRPLGIAYFEPAFIIPGIVLCGLTAIYVGKRKALST